MHAYIINIKKKTYIHTYVYFCFFSFYFLVSPKINEETFFSTLTSHHVVIGSNNEFKCEAQGTPAPEVQWLLNTAILAEGRGLAILKVNNVQISGSDKYVCRATNVGGTDEKEMTLLVTCTKC